MTHNHRLDTATIYFDPHTDYVSLECEECGYQTEYGTYSFALDALKHHWKQNTR